LDIAQLPIKTYLKQGDALLPLLFISASDHSIMKVQETRWQWNWMGLLSCWSMLMKLIYRMITWIH
jgi:hypothetical protein